MRRGLEWFIIDIANYLKILPKFSFPFQRYLNVFTINEIFSGKMERILHVKLAKTDKRKIPLNYGSFRKEEGFRLKKGDVHQVKNYIGRLFGS